MKVVGEKNFFTCCPILDAGSVSISHIVVVMVSVDLLMMTSMVPKRTALTKLIEYVRKITKMK